MAACAISSLSVSVRGLSWKPCSTFSECRKVPRRLAPRVVSLPKRFCRLRVRMLRPVRAMDASYSYYGGYGERAGYTLVFPRINVTDPYKRLGVSRDANPEEIQEARNFLIEQYAEHERSVEAIEAAYDKILMKSFKERKHAKINLRSKLKQKVEESPPWVNSLIGLLDKPERVIVYRRAFLFAVFAVWSIVKSAEGGPAFQVAVALGTCIYLLYDKIKTLGRASILGFGSLVVGWLIGSVFTPFIPSYLLPVTWTPELVTSLIAYIFLFFGCTFLK